MSKKVWVLSVTAFYDWKVTTSEGCSIVWCLILCMHLSFFLKRNFVRESTGMCSAN